MKKRINKYIAERGYASRREADKLIEEGKVYINKDKARLGDLVDDTDNITIAGRKTEDIKKHIYILLNKPVGFITTTDTTKKDNVINLVKHKERLFPVGRLDVRSSGLLLLTNDGDLTNKLIHPRYEHEKEYEVVVHKPLEERALKALASGVRLKDGVTLPAIVKQINAKKFSIILKEGRNRQIRRMCQALKYEVVYLTRTRMSSLKLGPLKKGEWRYLTAEEIKDLKNI